MITSVVSAYYIFKPSAQMAAQSIMASGRSPASIKPVEFVNDNHKVAVKPFETTLKLDCQELFSEHAIKTSASVSSDHVILKVSNCSHALSQLKNIDLVNKTNGYNAQLFKLNKAELNSDFIQLDKGENQLQFEISLNDGQKKQQIFKIQRIQ